MKFKLSDISSMKYGSLPKHKSVDGQYPIFTGYKTSGYSDEFNVEDPEIVVVARGVGGTGDVKMAPGPAWITNLSIIVRVNPDLVNKKYLQLKLAGMGLRYLDSGSAQSQITIKDLSEVKIDLPDLDVQTKVAKTIQMFEDKISNLQAINDNLLELGRSYYQNFVDTHDTEGQMVSTIAESVITGKTPSTKDESNYGDDVPFVTIPDMHSQIFTTKTTRSLSKKGADSQVKKYLPPFTLSVSSIGTPGLVTINPEESQTNQQINSVIAEEEKIWYLFLAFDSLKAHIENMGSGGSTILNLNKSNFEKIDIDWPIDKSALIEFNTVIEPIFMNILNNQREINSLSMVRDTLISELI